MKKFKEFYITGHTFDPDKLVATFSYSFDHEINFTETIDFSNGNNPPSPSRRGVGGEVMDNILSHLSLALAVSYYKLYPTDNLYIESFSLNEDQISFWKQFYINGLGEYFFTNKIKPSSPNFISTGALTLGPSTLWPMPRNGGGSTAQRALVPIGGGKDSLVGVEMIKKTGIPFNTITFGKDYPLHRRVSRQIEEPRLVINRTIDPLLFEMNEQGYYNGHVPITGIIAFVLNAVSYLYGYKYIVMANEKSANEGNTTMEGIEINHQRSKGLEFEKAFSAYTHKYISSDIQYFSLLRGMYEIKIVEQFCQYPQYFDTFSSCNRNFHITSSPLIRGDSGGFANKRRCGECPKCAFVYTLMSAFLPQKQIIQIFDKDMFADASLEPLFKELLGISGIKPFECVGTNEEVILAIYKHYQNDSSESPIIKLFKDKILSKLTPSDFEKLEEKLMKIYDDDNIPTEIKNKIILDRQKNL